MAVGMVVCFPTALVYTLELMQMEVRLLLVAMISSAWPTLLNGPLWPILKRVVGRLQFRPYALVTTRLMPAETAVAVQPLTTPPPSLVCRPSSPVALRAS